ncbi:MAG: polysaccharide deacetylase family protein, partial [Proteobacteria bacterium]|nr:polysaccharide deacetylase family protein [Pseudomonadota bacterium]
MLVLAKLKKFSLLWLKWALGLAVSLSIVGCRPLKAGKTCNLSAEGLRGSAYQGGLLPDLQLSLAFLRGPSEITEQIGGFLEQRSIQATFFVKGAAVFKREGELQRLRDQGHLIGHGGFSFTPFQQTRQAVLDIRKADELISPYTT